MDTINKLEKIISGLEDDPPPGQLISKTISIRIPVLDLAKIDALASMKDVSRNILLNEIIDAALSELLEKLKTKNPELAATLETKAQELSKVILAEHEPPPASLKHKHRKPHELE
jgi:hypothetical protein